MYDELNWEKFDELSESEHSRVFTRLMQRVSNPTLEDLEELQFNDYESFMASMQIQDPQVKKVILGAIKKDSKVIAAKITKRKAEIAKMERWMNS